MINLYHLRYFVDAARTGSLSEAARKNRVSQSAVSQAIRALERSLELQLTSRRAKAFHLTDEGKAVVLRADQVFRSIEEMSQSAREIGTMHVGDLPLACTNSLAMSLVPEVLSSVFRDHPKLRPILRLGNSETIKDWVLQGACELGILVDDGAIGRDFAQKKIRKGSYLLFQSPSTPPGGLEKSGLIVTRRERPEVRHFVQNLKRHLGKEVEVRFEITSWEVIKRYLLRNGGFGIAPDYVIQPELEKGSLRETRLPFKNPGYVLVAVWAAKRPLSRNASMILERLPSGGERV